jgi:hypothetical protein
MFKKIIKACLPYGLIILYRKIYQKPIINFNTYKDLKPLEPHLHKSPQFIVTLTSYGRRVNEKTPYAIYSLFNQSVQPDRIVLWLAHGTKISEKLQKLQKIGLEIHFCEDIRSYTKLIPALDKFPDDILITADDDIFYHKDWFKTLKEAYISEPKKIHCHRAHEIILDENKNIVPYKEWRMSIKSIEYPSRIFPTGVGGVLYPPKLFNNEIMNKEKFQSLAPTADDVWFWAMAHYSNIKYNLVKDCISQPAGIGKNDDGLLNINVTNNRNDEQIQNMIKEYPSVYKRLLTN